MKYLFFSRQQMQYIDKVSFGAIQALKELALQKNGICVFLFWCGHMPFTINHNRYTIKQKVLFSYH
jgi:hypothetical protein